jgi:hypothetical protein
VERELLRIRLVMLVFKKTRLVAVELQRRRQLTSHWNS